ncbi:thymidine kinase [Haloquadratum walsbyi]|jgi:Thymidine kinase|uniref:Thymidine kinase n=1 Tax=Haloquadratum walsbyi J07HQW2 TaxID=1238425 RepID=U1PWR4_9EURY|nr:thymidine kinase [Haloquadratum walsbyi]ERG96856.1 MAG: thymidine kinase [Haloquadratum walsbyi J07HQW2]
MHAITNSGWIEVVTGSMFSGKTEELLRRLRRAEIAGQSVAVFKPAVDDRYGETTVGSHAGRQWEAAIVPNEGDGIWEIKHEIQAGMQNHQMTTESTDTEEVTGNNKLNPSEDDPIDIVAIDEANFFSTELVSVCEELANDGYRVVVSGTDQTYRGEPFKPLPQLMAVAEYVDKLQAICTQCGEPATRNQRLVDNAPAHVDDPTIIVGADESYEARCRNCHSLQYE